MDLCKHEKHFYYFKVDKQWIQWSKDKGENYLKEVRSQQRKHKDLMRRHRFQNQKARRAKHSTRLRLQDKFDKSSRMSRSTLTRKVEWQIEDEIDVTEYEEKDGPPEVSKEQLEELDREAMLKEVEAQGHEGDWKYSTRDVS